MSLEYLDININKSIYPHNILLLSGASAPRFVAACLEVSVEVGPVDQGVDAAAEGGRQQHEVRHKRPHLAINCYQAISNQSTNTVHFLQYSLIK